MRFVLRPKYAFGPGALPAGLVRLRFLAPERSTDMGQKGDRAVRRPSNSLIASNPFLP